MIFDALWDSASDGELALVNNGMCRFYEDRHGQVTIREILVLPGHHKQGIGTYLLALVMEKCPHATNIFAKVPAYLPANAWFRTQKFSFEGDKLEDGMTFNEWRLTLSDLEFDESDD